MLSMESCPDYDVFISVKNTDDKRRQTPDSQLASKLFHFLVGRGLRVFFSQRSLESLGASAYSEAIDEALNHTRTLVAVGTSSSNLFSRWVRYEWDGFHTDIRSGRKPDGRLFAYVDGVPIDQLPRALRQSQCIQHGLDSMETLYRFIINRKPVLPPQGGPAPRVLSINSTEQRRDALSDGAGQNAPTVTVRLADGKVAHYVEAKDPPCGAMKRVYFTQDRRQAVKLFYRSDAEQVQRLRLVVERYNVTIPTLAGGMGGSVRSAAYFRRCFSWPTAVITEPSVGVVVPLYPARFFFASGPFEGKEKDARWFTRNRPMLLLPKRERGELIDRLGVCASLARSTRKLHQAGLAHSDLSASNVLVDFRSGTALVSDVESLTVPGIVPAEVLGTQGYVAPEVLQTIHLPQYDPGKRLPGVHADEHSLAVLIYELLFVRHPLRGPKIHSTQSVEEDELLSMGKNALFIEDACDPSNAVPGIRVPYTAYGPQLATCFYRAFVEGLHDPPRRPSAWEWERALVALSDYLYPCPNPDCEGKWLLLDEATLKALRCPSCGYLMNESVPRLEIVRRDRNGFELPLLQLAMYDGMGIYDWHLAFIYPGEEAEHMRRAHIRHIAGGWCLYPQGLRCCSRQTQGPAVTWPTNVDLTDGGSYVFRNGDAVADVKVII